MDLVHALRRSRIERTDRLDDDAVRALWRFRLGHIDLRPDVSEDDDFLAFQQDLRHPDLVWTVTDRTGGLRMMMLVQRRRVALAGRSRGVLFPEYGFVDHALRGHPVVPLSLLVLLVLGLVRLRSLRACLASASYPASYISWARGLPAIASVGTRDLSVARREELHAVGRALAGSCYRAQDGTIAARTRPRPGRAPRSRSGREVLADFERMDPDWRQGRTLLWTQPLAPMLLLRFAADVVLRWARRLPSSRRPAYGTRSMRTSRS